MIDLLVVDDHRIFRAGLVRLLSDEADIRVRGESGDSSQAMAMLRTVPCDLVLLDIAMGPQNGLDTLRQIRREFSRLPVIMLSMYEEAQYVRLAIKAGARAYLTKDVSPDELLRAVRRVAQGESYLPARLGSGRGRGAEAFDLNPVDDARPGTRQTHDALSPREMQVMLKIARGVSLTEIGIQMCVSVKTVSTHRAHILEKLGIVSNAELIRYALRHGLVD